MFPTCSYFIQQIFGKSAGDYYYGDCVKIDSPDKTEGDGYLQEQSTVLDSKNRRLYVKVCNASGNQKTAHVDISRFKPKKMAEMTTLSGNPEDENNFDAQPVAPKVESVKAQRKFDLTLPPYSFTMLEYEL